MRMTLLNGKDTKLIQEMIGKELNLYFQYSAGW